MVNPTQVTFKNGEVGSTFQGDPTDNTNRLLQLRQLVFEAVSERGLDDIEETLKWGEPSCLSKKGSTIRMSWRESKANQYAVFFNCNTRLIETFREVYHDTFEFEGNCAIVFNEKDKAPKGAIKHCIALSSLTYHKVKHLSLLGV